MAAIEQQLNPGLYLVATPIGSARDITLRALDVMQSADLIVAEDTRMTRRLMNIHDIRLAGRPFLSYHDRNGRQQRPAVMAALKASKSVCLLSDAGSPLIADPGWKLVQEVVSGGIPIHVVPGPSSVIASLLIAGLPTNRFMFAGFIPSQVSARRLFLEELAEIPSTLIFFETAQRLAESLVAISDQFGGNRQVAVCREITKKFEEVWRGKAEEIATKAVHTSVKGEIVILVGLPKNPKPSMDLIAADLQKAMLKASIRDAVAIVAEAHGVKRRDVYQMAIKLS